MTTKTWTDTADFSDATADVTVNNGLALRHQGGINGEAWDTTHHPDTSGETLSGWTFTNSGGATATAGFSSGKLRIGMKAEQSTSKKSTYWRATNASVGKSTSFTISVKQFQRGSLTTDGCVYFGLFNSESESPLLVNSIYVGIPWTGQPFINVFDSAGSQDNAVGQAADILNDTDYWLRIVGNGTTIAAKFYSSSANYDSDTAFRTLTVNVSDVSGTVTCNRLGFANPNHYTDQARAETWTITAIDSNASDFYTDANATATSVTFETLQRIDWSAFDASETGTVKYDILKKSTSGGSFTTVTNGGAHYTKAQLIALEDENLYGVGFIAYLDTDGATRVLADGIAITYGAADTTAPDLLAAADLAAMTGHPEIDDMILVWKQGTDAGSGFWFHALRREDADGGNVEYLIEKADTNGMLYEWSEDEFDTATAYKFFNDDKGAESVDDFDCASRAFLVDGHTAGKVYKIGGVDAEGNNSWTEFPLIASSVSGLAVGSPVVLLGGGTIIYLGGKVGMRL